MPLYTKRWNDPPGPDDGLRILICRFRPRGVAKADETWDAWRPDLGPSKELLKAFNTTTASPIAWPDYSRRYLAEQRLNRPAVIELAEQIKTGNTITLLCSSNCVREERCHRSLLKALIEKYVNNRDGETPAGNETAG